MQNGNTTPDAPLFDSQGNLVYWQALGREWVETRPIRQNAPAEFRGILIWTKSAGQSHSAADLLHIVEWDFETELLEDLAERRVYLRRGKDWTLRLCWSWREQGLKLSCDLLNGSDERRRQVEFSYWVPAENGGTLRANDCTYTISPYGRIQDTMLERGAPLSFQTPDGRRITLTTDSAESRSHFYHRGFCLKMGTGSPTVAPGEKLCFQTECEVSVDAPPIHAAASPPLPESELPDLRQPTRAYRLGLMLHLQYTPLPNVTELLERWIALSAKLGFDYILLELDRGLRAHPAAPPHALDLAQCRELAAHARRHGIGLHPMYNLLGHQWETSILDWQPSWQETAFSGLCPSHPEVRTFAAELIRDLAEAFDSSWVHIGGDELKLPDDGKDALICPRCGVSPNLSAIVDYWNFLSAEAAPPGVELAIWGDQLLPANAIAPGLTAHNWDGRGLEHLKRLDQRIRIFDWQYGGVSPASSLQFLGRASHRTAVTSACEGSLQSPFIHAEACRAGHALEALHTTWASPDPRDLPLEGVAAAALAHAGLPYDPTRTPEECARLASRMLRELRGR
jgi:hypothetical protein